MDTTTCTTSENINQINQKLNQIAKKIRIAFDQHNYALAKQLILNHILKIAPNHPIALNDLAFAEYQLGDYQQAYDYLLEALNYSKTNVSTIYDTLVSVCIALNRTEEAYYYAKLSIQSKKQEVALLSPTVYPLPHHKTLGLSSDKTKNIIAYSLFGQSPRYCETAVINSQLAPLIYPEWTCRFYVNDSVPLHVIKRLKLNQAEVVYVDKTKIHFSGLFWRFLVLDDPNVHCFMIRDADSLLSYKEQAAVKQWLNSGKFFHLMRDNYAHSELILAGMWGGYTSVFPNIQQSIEQYYTQLNSLNKTIDQYFLRECIWPTVNQNVLVHDNYHLDNQSEFFPEYQLSDIEKIPLFHIGMVDAHAKNITIPIHQTAKQVRWSLYNPISRTHICSYETTVVEQNGEFHFTLNLPYFYSQKIEQKQWEIRYNIIK